MEVSSSTRVECKRGDQLAVKHWGQIAFEYIGAKSPELKRVHRELERDGVSVWQGVTLSVQRRAV